MRLRDALRTLLGLREETPATRAELNQLRREWHEYQGEMAGLLDQLNRAIGRWSKREQREAKRLAAELAEAQEPVQRELPVLPADRKAAIRARLRAGGAPVPIRRMNMNGEGDE